MMRNIFAVLGGLIDAFIIFALFQMVSHAVYPLPAGIDIENPDTLRNAELVIPAGALALVLLGYMAGSFMAGLVASLIAPLAARRNAFIIGIILTLAGIANLVMIHHPGWFWLSLIVYIPLALLGAKTGLSVKKRKTLI